MNVATRTKFGLFGPLVAVLVFSAGPASALEWPSQVVSGHERLIAAWSVPCAGQDCVASGIENDLLESPSALILRTNYGFDQEVRRMPILAADAIAEAREDDWQLLIPCAGGEPCVETWSDVSGAAWFVASHESTLRIHFGANGSIIRDQVAHALRALVHTGRAAPK
jgi:hypothetical protein